MIGPHQPSILDALVRRALDGPPDRVAVHDGDRVVTFGALADRVGRLSRSLFALAGPTGGRVAVAMGNRAEYVDLYLACFRAGLAIVPLHPDLPEEVAEAAGARTDPAVIVHDAQGSRVAQAAARGLHRVPAVIRVGDPGDRWPPEDGEAPGESMPRPAADTPAAIFLSSGTTGAPKCVVVTHANWAAGLAALRAAFGRWVEDDVFVHVTALSHTTGEMILPALLARARQRIIPAGDVPRAARLLAMGDATRLFVFSPMLADLTREVRASLRPARLRSVLYGGAPAPLPVVEEALEVLGPVLEQGFGQTETFPPTLALRKEEHVIDGPIGRSIRASIGRPVGFSGEVRLLGPQGTREVPDGEPGELAVRGDNVTPGYLGDPDATAAAMRNGFFLTGDMAVRDERGYLHLLGRRADRMECRGTTTYPRRIEAVAELHSDVLEAAACRVDGRLALAAVPRPGRAAGLAETLRGFLAERLAPAERPDEVVMVDDLPRNVNLKLQRGALVARLALSRRRG